MPNLFVEMLGVGESDVDQKLRAAWNHIFRGDPVDEAVYFEVRAAAAETGTHSCREWHGRGVHDGWSSKHGERLA